MKKVMVLLLLLLIGMCLMAQRPHQVIVEVVASDGSVPTGTGDEVVNFTGDLYRNSATVGGQVTQTTTSCYYYQDGFHGVVVIDIDKCTSSWAFSDVLVIKVTCAGEKGQATVVIGSLGDNKDEVPVGQGIQLLEVTVVSCDNGVEVTEDLTNGDFSLISTGDGTVDVSAPANDFTSLPSISRDGRATNVDQCFSVEFSSGITQLATSFSWASSDITGNMGDKDLLVSVDGVNWIYSNNSASGITGDVEWDFDDTPDPDEMIVSFTTTQDNALYAVSNGTDPDVTTPNAPAGGTASANGIYVTISCRAVAVPGATYQAYYSTDYSNWISIVATYGGGTISQTITHNMAGTVMYYGLKAYNDNDTYLSGIGSTIYTYQENTFQTDSGNMTNLIPIPFEGFNNNFDDARLLGITLGSNCNAIAKWDATTQRYSYCTCYAGAWRGNFDLEPDGVYFVNLAGAVAAKTYDGKMNTSDFELKTGVNLIYVSALDASLANASDLMSDIGAHCTKVQQWDTTNQEWDTYESGRDDFSLSKLNPVFVYVNANVSYIK